MGALLTAHSQAQQEQLARSAAASVGEDGDLQPSTDEHQTAAEDSSAAQKVMDQAVELETLHSKHEAICVLHDGSEKELLRANKKLKRTEEKLVALAKEHVLLEERLERMHLSSPPVVQEPKPPLSVSKPLRARVEERSPSGTAPPPRPVSAPPFPYQIAL